MWDIIIVGAGPAGLTAALYALRANKKVLIFEAKTYGGQIINAVCIENYPGIDKISGFDYATNLYNQVVNLGAEFKFETVLKVDENRVVYTNKNTYQAKSIILATGAENRKLKIAREEQLVGRGISYCATCDGNFYKGKDVAVVGGGNTALEDAIYLSNLANKVYLIHRRDEFRADDKIVLEVKEKDNIELVMNSNVVELVGDEFLESIVVDNNGTTRKINVNGLFIAVGQEPKNEIFKNVVDLDDKGYIISDDGVHTKARGIYVAGDARVKELRQLTTAVSDGAIASVVAIREAKEN